MGFTERKAALPGIVRLFLDLWNEYEKTLSNVRILDPFYWDDPTDDWADYLKQTCADDLEIMVVAYSWGCGKGFTSFAKDAKRLGIPIKVACLCDPVYRFTILPNWWHCDPTALIPSFKIEVPSSVKRVEWVRQMIDKRYVRGHDLVAENPDFTEIGAPTVVDCNHSVIDESEQFVSLVRREAARFLLQ